MVVCTKVQTLGTGHFKILGGCGCFSKQCKIIATFLPQLACKFWCPIDLHVTIQDPAYHYASCWYFWPVELTQTPKIAFATPQKNHDPTLTNLKNILEVSGVCGNVTCGGCYIKKYVIQGKGCSK